MKKITPFLVLMTLALPQLALARSFVCEGPTYLDHPTISGPIIRWTLTADDQDHRQGWHSLQMNDVRLYEDFAQTWPTLRQEIPWNDKLQSWLRIDNALCEQAPSSFSEDVSLIASCRPHRYSMSALSTDDGQNKLQAGCGNIEGKTHGIWVMVDRARKEVRWVINYGAYCRRNGKGDYQSLTLAEEQRFKLSSCQFKP